MAIVLDSNIPVYESSAEAENLAASRLPPPANLDKANNFYNPLGEAPGRGWVLLLRADYDRVQKNQLHTLRFARGNEVILLRELVLVGARGVTCGAANDPKAAMLIELADRRHQLANDFLGVACNKQYNVRAPAYTLDGTAANRFYADSLNAGALWTWQTMVTDLWELMPQLGASSDLPYTPDGTPEEFVFPGVSAYEALNHVLKRIGCAIRWNGVAASDQYSIVQIGAEDVASDRTIRQATNANRLIYDGEFEDDNILYGRLPGNIRVCFNVLYDQYGSEETVTRTSAQAQTGSVYELDIGAPQSISAKADPDVTHIIWDDMAAIYDYSGALTNLVALTTRAQDRADTFFKMVNGTTAADGEVPQPRMQKVFTGIVAIQPGSTIKGVRWGADAFGIAAQPGGIITEVVRHPYWMLQADDSPGGWGCCCDMGSSNDQAPNFAPGLPVYPHYLQIVNVSNGTASANNVFPGNVLRYNSTNRAFETKEECRLKEITGCTAITAGNYHGRLSGFDPEGFPTYLIRNFASSGGGNSNTSITYENSTVTFDANSTLTINELIQTANTSNVTSDKNNWVLGNQTLRRANVTANACVSGIQAGSDGQLREIQNVGNSIMRIRHESSDSAAANRIWTVDGQDWYIMANCSIGMKYVASASRWEMLWPTGRDVGAKITSAANTIPAATIQAPEFTVATYNTGNMRNGNFGFTIPVRGKYLVGYHSYYDMSGGNEPSANSVQWGLLEFAAAIDACSIVASRIYPGDGNVFVAACVGILHFEQVYDLTPGTTVVYRIYNGDTANAINATSAMWAQKIDKAG